MKNEEQKELRLLKAFVCALGKAGVHESVHATYDALLEFYGVKRISDIPQRRTDDAGITVEEARP